MPDLLSTFRHALVGLRHGVRSQRNARIHLAATLTVAGLALWLRLDLAEAALLVVSIGLVWAAELFNTALEALVDLVSPQTQPLARVAKDVSAAAVLMAALSAALVGALILGPALLNRLN